MNATVAEQREYFRVDDEVLLAWRTVDEAEVAIATRHLLHGAADAFGVAAQLAASSRHTEVLHKRVAASQPEVAAYLATLDRKIDLIGRLLLGQASEARGARLLEADLSATGIGFDTDEALDEGACLELRIVLLPTHVGVQALGRVVRSVAGAGGGWRVAVNFETISAADRESLIEHVLGRQQTLLRERRRGPDED